MTTSRHAIIAGAGIGGLTAALMLAEAGFRITILERAAAIQEAGAGLQLSPNATAILARLGIIEKLAGLAVTPDRLRIRRASSGSDIIRLPLGPMAELRWGAPMLVVHRADLQSALLSRVAQDARIDLRTGVTVSGFVASPDRVSVATLKDFKQAHIDGDLLLGADGANSVIRSRLGLGFGDKLHYSGRTAWRALISGENAPEFALKLETSLWLGAHAHLVHYPLREGAVVNIVAITNEDWRNSDSESFWSEPGDPSQLLRRFAGWHSEARRLIGAATEWRRWPLFDRNPISRWTISRVALLGDAAHPMLPFFAQGAAQAIEDAAALGSAFSPNDSKETPDIASGLSVYERKRVQRAARVQRASRQQGVIYHLPGLAGMARDVSMRMVGVEGMMSKLDWLYGYRE